MAPKAKPVTKGVKRVAGEEVSKVSAKAPRVDPAMQAVQDVIEHAEGLPESCKAMLLASLPGSLCVAKDLRIPIQARVVEMIGEVIETRRSSLQAAIDIEQAKVAELESSKSRLEEDVVKTEAALKHASEVVASKRSAAHEATMSSEAASIKLKEAKAVQAAFDEQLAKAETERREVQEVTEKSVPSLCGDAFQPDAAAGHRDAIMGALGRSTRVFESTLLMTLPEALIKAPAERGAFDTMAIDTLKSNLTEHVEKLGAELAAAEESKSAHASAVQVAEVDATKAHEADAAAKSDVATAEEAQKAAAGDLLVAKTAQRNFEPSLASAVAKRDTQQSLLTTFQEHNVKYFTSLESKTSTTIPGEFGKMGA